MSDLSHLNAIELRLSHERVRAQQASTAREREWREHEVRMIERERESEISFLAKHGIVVESPAEMTIDEILADLSELEKERAAAPAEQRSEER